MLICHGVAVARLSPSYWATTLLDCRRAAAAKSSLSRWGPRAAKSPDQHIITGRAGHDTKSLTATPLEHHKAKELPHSYGLLAATPPGQLASTLYSPFWGIGFFVP